MRVTLLGVCLFLSVICCLRAAKIKSPAFCPLRLRDKVQVIQCTWQHLSGDLQYRLQQVMQYNQLNVPALARFVCTPQATFSLRKVFTKKQIKEGIAAGMRCMRRVRTNPHVESNGFE
uniref:Pancreatic trypsin inhibitor n=1 Tax=Rhipicephalus zambeziensis TaxID=60191 RepID=A0A224YCY3_9ACAR